MYIYISIVVNYVLFFLSIRFRMFVYIYIFIIFKNCMHM